MNWEPFTVVPPGERADPPRAIETPEGVGDRLRTAAFAEVQARDAFRWASDRFAGEASDDLRAAWRSLAHAEQRHLDWLLARMKDLGIAVDARKVSDQLWRSLQSCKTACEFALYMATAEERGRKAGERFHQKLLATDRITAEIFGKIAQEEIAHIALAEKSFPREYIQERAFAPRP